MKTNERPIREASKKEQDENIKEVKKHIDFLNKIQKNCGSDLFNVLNEQIKSKNKPVFNYAEFVEVIEIYATYNMYSHNRKEYAIEKAVERIVLENHSELLLSFIFGLLNLSELGKQIVNCCLLELNTTYNFQVSSENKPNFNNYYITINNYL